jgi:hypothetical protein
MLDLAHQYVVGQGAEAKAGGYEDAETQACHRADAQQQRDGGDRAVALHLRARYEAARLHDEAHARDRGRLRRFAHEGHDAGETALAPLAGYDLVHVGHIIVGRPRDIVERAASQPGQRDRQPDHGAARRQARGPEADQCQRARREGGRRYLIGGAGRRAQRQVDGDDNGQELDDIHGAEQPRCDGGGPGERENHEEGEGGIENILADIAAQIHAQMQAEGADAHGGKQVAVERLQSLSRPTCAARTGLRRRCAGHVPFPAEQIKQPGGGHEQDGEDDPHVEEGVGAVAAQRLDQPERQEAREDGGRLAEKDARAGEFRLGAIVARHFGGQRFERDDLHRIDEFEQHIADQIIPKALPRQPHQREAGQQRNGGEDEEAAAAELAAEPGAAEMVRNIADHRRRKGVEDARHREDGRRLTGGKTAKLGVEDQHPARNDRHRPRAQHVVRAISEIIVQADRAGRGLGCFGHFRLLRHFISVPGGGRPSISGRRPSSLSVRYRCAETRPVRRWPGSGHRAWR